MPSGQDRAFVGRGLEGLPEVEHRKAVVCLSFNFNFFSWNIEEGKREMSEIRGSEADSS